MHYHGQVLVVLDLEVQRNLLHIFAQMAAETATKAALIHGLKTVDVFVKGPGSGRSDYPCTFSLQGLEVTSIKDVTPVPHNGCRPPKRRRV